MKTVLRQLIPENGEDRVLNVGYLLMTASAIEAAVHEAEMRLDVSRVLGDSLSDLERLAISVLGLAQQAQEDIKRAN